MNLFLLNILLAAAWAALTGNFAPDNLLFGYLLSYLILWLVSRHLVATTYFARVPRVIRFILFFLWELVRANVKVALTVLSPRPKLKPAVVAVPLDLDNIAAITLLMNLITLTPGTLALDVSSDRSVIFIHTIDVQDADTFRQQIKKGLERRVKELFE